MIAQALHAGRVNIGVGGHDATVAKSTQVLGGEEAVGTNVANTANAATVHVFGTDGLCTVFNNRQIPRLGDRHDAVKIRSLTKEMHGHQALHLLAAAKGFFR